MSIDIFNWFIFFLFIPPPLSLSLCHGSRKDLSLKDCKIDILLITGMLSPYASVVEKLHRDVNKERVTILKVERAGDVLADAVSWQQCYIHIFPFQVASRSSSSFFLLFCRR